MESQSFQARRAMLEDLDALRMLWAPEQQAGQSLEKTFTDFQVVEDADGRIVAALAMRITGNHGCIHSELYEDFGLADRLRPLIWQRLQTVAANRGLVRLWTQESAAYWREQGFAPAGADVLGRLPGAFDNGRAGWFTLKLKEDILAGLTPEQEFELFRKSVQADTERMKSQARLANMIALAVAVIFAILVIVMLFVWRKYDDLKRSGKLPAPTTQQP
jgi:N-acetylglutamate synthase-like GNAT family acetyltransferase